MTTITVKSGSEGPRHDPYYYEEITVRRPDGRQCTLHVGLGVWAEAGRRRTTEEAAALSMFAEYAGVDYEIAQRAYREYQARKITRHACGTRFIHDVSGYPGETLTVCGKCGAVIDSHFDRGAVE